MLSLMLGAGAAAANIWPSSHERVARELASSDPGERRAAAASLLGLPPEVARPLAQRALLDVDVEVRLFAARAATELGVDGATDAVVSWLSDPDPRLRVAACKLIDVAPTAQAVQALGRVLGDADAAVRGAAAEAMGSSGFGDAVPPLLGHVDDSVTAVRLAVVRALGRIGDRRAVVPLVSKLQDPEADVRQAAARVLGTLGDLQAAPTLMLALQDSSDAVRSDALAALGRLRAQDAVAAIAALLASAESAGAGAGSELSAPTREAALRALGRIGNAQAVKLLLAELEREGVPAAGAADEATSPVRHALVLAGAPATEALMQALRTTASPRLASAAALGLGELRAKQAVPLVLRGAQRGTVSLGAAFRALGELGGSEALPFLLEHLDDSDVAVRRSVVDVLGTLLDPALADGRPVDPIRPRVVDGRTALAERIALVHLLGRTGSPRAQDVLLGLWASESPALRTAVVQALGDLGLVSPRVDALLFEALGASSPRLRRAAASALGRVGRDEAARQLLQRLDVAAEQDRGAVGLALSGALGRSQERELVERVAQALARTSATGRDALIEGLGRMALPEAGRLLAQVAERAEADDRRKAAEALGGHAGELAALRRLAQDADPTVRANALWSIGRVGGEAERTTCTESLRDVDVAVAGNAAVALALIAVRKPIAGDLASPLCVALGDYRSYVRVNALVGLRLLGKQCAGTEVTRLLLGDRSWRVRQAAADLLGERMQGARPSGSSTDARALARCAAEDKDATVAAHCRERRAVPQGTDDVLVFVVPVGRSAPEPRSPFALERADGSLRLGVSDRRGALFELAAPRGTIRLAEPAALAP
jgi:HEAT repeat protein